MRSCLQIADSYAFLSPSREFWTQTSRQNRIRHVDPPPNAIFSNIRSSRSEPEPKIRTSDADKKCVTVCNSDILAFQNA